MLRSKWHTWERVKYFQLVIKIIQWNSHKKHLTMILKMGMIQDIVKLNIFLGEYVFV